MRTLILVLASLALSFVTLAPAASASPCNPTDCPAWVCDQLGNACHPQVPNDKPYVHRNSDGSVTLGITECDENNFCSNQDIVTIPAPKVPQVPTFSTYSRSNPDGSTTYGYTECSNNVCTDHNLATVPAVGSIPPPPSTCFAYNPDALTNACVTTGTAPVTLPFPVVGPPQPLCVLGPECVNVPTVGVGSITENVPTVSGYAEATVLCPELGDLCHVDLS